MGKAVPQNLQRFLFEHGFIGFEAGKSSSTGIAEQEEISGVIAPSGRNGFPTYRGDSSDFLTFF
jgi:hypothetical protein